MKIKDAKSALSRLISELDKFDENSSVLFEIDDNCGGTYIGNLESWGVRQCTNNMSDYNGCVFIDVE